jgi:hypothetical protein
MIEFTAKRNILPYDDNNLTLGSSNFEPSENSDALGMVVGKKPNISQLNFVLGSSNLGQGAAFFKEEKTKVEKIVLSKYQKFSEYVLFSTSFFAMPSVNFIIDIDPITQSRVTEANAYYSSGEIRVEVGIKIEYADYYITNGLKIWLSYTTKNTIGYAVSNAQSDMNGSFAVPFSIFVDDKHHKATSLSIAFDVLNNRHPNSVVVDGVEYFVDNAIFTVAGLTPQATHKIEVSDWNAPNSPFVVMGIYSDLSIDIDRHNIISIETSLYDRGDFRLPSFGVISNSGQIEFYDTDGKVADYADKLLLNKGLPCGIFLENTLSKNAKETIALLETDEWTYDEENKKVSVRLKDDLEEWQDITVDEIYYNAKNPSSKTLRWYYEKLHEITTKDGNYKMLSFDELDEETKTILDGIIIPYPLLYSGSLWSSWQKVCEVGQLHIYKEKGTVKCRYNGGN